MSFDVPKFLSALELCMFENLEWFFRNYFCEWWTSQYIYHSNRLDELIPNMYRTWVNSIDLTTFGRKMVKIDRFWSFYLVWSEHTTYTHHWNRLDELIPNMYRTWVNSIDLTTFGRKNGQNWPFLVILFSLVGTYYIYPSLESAWQAYSDYLWKIICEHR